MSQKLVVLMEFQRASWKNVAIKLLLAFAFFSMIH